MNAVPQSPAIVYAELLQNEIHLRTSPPQHLVDLVRGTEFDSPTLVVGRIEEVVRSIDRINAALPVGQSEIVDDFRAIGVLQLTLHENLLELKRLTELYQLVSFGVLLVAGVVCFAYLSFLQRKIKVMRREARASLARITSSVKALQASLRE